MSSASTAGGQSALAQSAIEEVLEVYPETAAKNRNKHLGVQDDKGCNVNANRKAVPGVMTSRGCAYAGSKGVVWGPVKDMVHISHGPVGCGYYSWAGRRNYYVGTTGVDSFGTMNFTSDFQEKDIVFGGDKKLTKIVEEIDTLFPLSRGVSIQSECPVGLIGDDIEAVARKTSAEIGKPVIPLRCEGFRGVSQSLGHHIANDAIRDWLLEKPQGVGAEFEPGPYDVSLIGDYNIGGDAWASRILFEEMGLRVVSQWSGDGTLSELENGPKGRVVLLHCYRSMNYLARFMEERHDLPFYEFNLFGPSQIEKHLRGIAALFDERIQENAEKVIARYKPMADAVIDKYRPRLEGKKVMLYVGGLRPRHTVDAFRDLGIEVVGTGYEFAHKDDYQRTTHYTNEGTLIYDDVNQFEFDRFVEKLNPDLVASGIKEKYVFQKTGKPFRQMHSWDYSGPYHGYDGFAIFARDMDMTVNNPVWGMVQDPWA